jgi:hypothetical protein
MKNNGIVNIGDADYLWNIYRQPRWTTGRVHGYTLLGPAVLVEASGGKRELLLEFEIEQVQPCSMPQHHRFRLGDGRLIEAIVAAMAEGWDPHSRGKRFVFAAGYLQLA